MSDLLSVYHGSPNELVVIGVTINGTTVTAGYQVCIYPVGVQPIATDPGWITPQTAGTDSGIFIGSDNATRTFTAGQVLQPWYYLIDTPEKIIAPTSALVYVF